MKTTVPFVFFLSGLSPVLTYIREYHYVKMLKTWAGAQSYCRERFDDLATVSNQDDNSRLLNVSEGLGNFAWIGLHDDLTAWRWTLEYTNFNKSTNFRNWGSSEPNNKFSNQRCTVMNVNRLWEDLNCNKKHSAVCYNEKGPSKYILVTTKMTMYHAKNFCRSNYTDLVRVSNMSENNDIPQLSEKAWIGLYRRSWAKWSDRSPRTFLNWKQGQPDNSGDTMESCVVVNTTTGKWLDADCMKKHYFVCYKIPVWHKKTLRLKFQSKSNLNDPAVQQQVLEQLHAKLEKHGFPDFKLRWIKTDGQSFHKKQKRNERTDEKWY